MKFDIRNVLVASSAISNVILGFFLWNAHTKVVLWEQVVQQFEREYYAQTVTMHHQIIMLEQQLVQVHDNNKETLKMLRELQDKSILDDLVKEFDRFYNSASAFYTAIITSSSITSNNDDDDDDDDVVTTTIPFVEYIEELALPELPNVNMTFIPLWDIMAGRESHHPLLRSITSSSFIDTILPTVTTMSSIISMAEDTMSSINSMMSSSASCIRKSLLEQIHSCIETFCNTIQSCYHQVEYMVDQVIIESIAYHLETYYGIETLTSRCIAAGMSVVFFSLLLVGTYETSRNLLFRQVQRFMLTCSTTIQFMTLSVLHIVAFIGDCTGQIIRFVGIVLYAFLDCLHNKLFTNVKTFCMALSEQRDAFRDLLHKSFTMVKTFCMALSLNRTMSFLSVINQAIATHATWHYTSYVDLLITFISLVTGIIMIMFELVFGSIIYHDTRDSSIFISFTSNMDPSVKTIQYMLLVCGTFLAMWSACIYCTSIWLDPRKREAVDVHVTTIRNLFTWGQGFMPNLTGTSTAQVVQDQHFLFLFIIQRLEPMGVSIAQFNAMDDLLRRLIVKMKWLDNGFDRALEFWIHEGKRSVRRLVPQEVASDAATVTQLIAQVALQQQIFTRLQTFLGQVITAVQRNIFILREVMELEGSATARDVKISFMQASKSGRLRHPDHGGSNKSFRFLLAVNDELKGYFQQYPGPSTAESGGTPTPTTLQMIEGRLVEHYINSSQSGKFDQESLDQRLSKIMADLALHEPIESQV